jgi:hypothetical protein
LQSKVKTKIDETLFYKLNEFKRRFYQSINKIASDVMLNNSRILINEEKDLLFSLSVLVDRQQANKLTRMLDKKPNNFSFQIAGPFAPYSFAQNEK